MVNLSKFISNKKILNKVTAKPCPYIYIYILKLPNRLISLDTSSLQLHNPLLKI